MTEVEGLTECFEGFLLEPTLQDLIDKQDGGFVTDGEIPAKHGDTTLSDDEEPQNDDSVTDAGPTRTRQIFPNARHIVTRNTETDAIFRNPKNKTKPGEHQVRKRYVNAEAAFEYNMSHERRGRAIIINEKNFDERTGMETRDGTDVDANNLLQTFGSLGFEAFRYDDLSVFEIFDLLEKVSKEDHSNCDSLVVAILTHGDEDEVYGRDGPIMIDQMTGYFRGDVCPTLAGKPKLFFIQACRGHRFDDGITVDCDDEVDAGRPQQLPVEADFLICYATVNGYYSWRNPTNGSWFVQALCHVLKHCSGNMDLLRMMTRVSKIVAYEFESNTGTSKELAHMNKKKQIPCIVSMLTKDLYFAPKKAVNRMAPSPPTSIQSRS